MGLSLASAPFPFVDLALGLQWLAGLFLAVLMPGYFLMGRFLHTQDPLSRFAASFASGMLIIPVVSLFLSAMRIPLFGILHTTMVILIAVVMGRSAWYQGAIKKLGKGIRPLTRWETVFILLFVLAQFTILISGLRSYCAPFHLHDASNHSFLALRVFESRSCWPSVLFTDQVGIPVIPYLTGWHTAAALSSDISSVAPYVSIWYLATFTAALFPLMMSLLWRAFGFESKTIILSTALASAIYYVPVGLFAWGGFGAMVGMGLFPWLVVVLREVVRSPSKTIAAFAGVFCISMIHIHAAELIVSLVFLLVAIPKARERTGFSGENVKGSLVTFALVILFGLLPLIPFLNAYNAVTDQSWQMTKTSFEVVWKDFWWAGSGGLTPLRYLAFFGLATGCFLPATRRVCILTLSIMVLYFTLRMVQDPVSLFLTRPFYQQPARLLYLPQFLIPLLSGAALVWILNKISRFIGPLGTRLVTGIAFTCLLVFVTWPGFQKCYAFLGRHNLSSPFSEQDYELAENLAGLEPHTAVFANLQADGSFWAMHVSGRNFLDPTGWHLSKGNNSDYRSLVPKLAENPWPEEVMPLKKLGCKYLYINDELLKGATPLLKRSDMAEDSRFKEVLQNNTTSVYRIIWDGAETTQNPN